MSTKTFNMRPTQGAACRMCGENPSNEMIILSSICYSRDRFYICQNCAKKLLEELQTVNLSGAIIPKKHGYFSEKEQEDLSKI